MEWQPIGTAPTDTEVFVYSDGTWDGTHLFIARQNQFGDWSDRDERESAFYRVRAEIAGLTHWMLPKPPA